MTLEQGVTLAVDPGNTTGVAFIGSSGSLLHDFQMTHEEFVEFLVHPWPAASQAMRHVKLVVVEDFQLLPHKGIAVSQKKSRNMAAARGIGAVDHWARSHGVELIYRDPSHWRIGLQLAGIEQSQWPKSHKDGHSTCAYGAGYHALVELGLVQSRLGSLR